MKKQTSHKNHGTGQYCAFVPVEIIVRYRLTPQIPASKSRGRKPREKFIIMTNRENSAPIFKPISAHQVAACCRRTNRNMAKCILERPKQTAAQNLRAMVAEIEAADAARDAARFAQMQDIAKWVLALKQDNKSY